MKIVDFLREAQYSRFTVGKRWMTIKAGGFTVFEQMETGTLGKAIGTELTEDEAVKLLIEGEELYHDLLDKC